MAFPIQAWNPTLLAALASPNVPDYAGRISAMDLNAAQREKMLAEMAYLPVQQRNEFLKNQAYLLQQGYMMGPDGVPVMTPAKEAELAAQQALIQRLGGTLNTGALPTSYPSPPPSVTPSPAPDMSSLTMPPPISNMPPAPARPPLPAFTLPAPTSATPSANTMVPRLNDMIDSGEAPAPAMPRQSTALPFSNDVIALAGVANLGVKPTDMIAANKNDIDLRKLEQDRLEADPSYQAQQEYSKEEAKEAVKSNFDSYNQIKTQYQADQKQALQLSQIENLFERGLKTGKVEEAVKPMREWLVATGLADKDTANQISLQQGMTALGNQLALRLRNPESGMGLTGNTSDRDVTFLLDGIETLSKTPEGNKIILDMQKASMEHNAKQFKYVAKLRSDNNGKLPKDFDQKIVEWNDSNPIFSDKQSKDLIKKAQAAGLGTGGQPAAADYKRMSNDELMREINGQ